MLSLKLVLVVAMLKNIMFIYILLFFAVPLKAKVGNKFLNKLKIGFTPGYFYDQRHPAMLATVPYKNDLSRVQHKRVNVLQIKN